MSAPPIADSEKPFFALYSTGLTTFRAGFRWWGGLGLTLVGGPVFVGGLWPGPLGSTQNPALTTL